MSTAIDPPVIITGPPRSGTSLLASYLAGCGVWTGDTVPGDSANPAGYFEHRQFKSRVLVPWLTRYGIDPGGWRVRGRLRGGQPSPAAVAEFRAQTLAAVDPPPGPWLLKDAKLVLLWPLVSAAFPRARWILTYRDARHIVRSARAAWPQSVPGDADLSSAVCVYLQAATDCGAWLGVHRSITLQPLAHPHALLAAAMCAGVAAQNPFTYFDPDLIHAGNDP